MDWTGLVRDTWRIVRRERALWSLGLISAIQAGMFALIVAGLIVPMTLLTQVLVSAQLEAAVPVPGSGASLQTMLPSVVEWLQRWSGGLVAGIVVIVVVWAFFGILDVAATAGAISEASTIAEGREASTRRGMRDGFRIWWRTVGLLAIAALPSLLYLLVVALFTLFTISIPIAAGQPPNLAAMRSGDTFNGLLSTVVGFAGIPLGVLVQLGLRYAVIEGQEWKAALQSAWRLARGNLTEVVLMYLMQAGISAVAGFAFAFLIALVAIGAGVTVAGLVGAAHTFSGAAMFVTVIAGLLVSTLVLALSAALFVWLAVIWTLFWRRITGREPGSVVVGVRPVPNPHALGPDGVVSEESQMHIARMPLASPLSN